MNGLEKIINEINNESSQVISTIIEEAQSQVDEILSDARKKADSKAHAIDEEARQKALDITSRVSSAKDLIEKRYILKAKQDAISEVFDKVKIKISSMPDDQYLDIIDKMIDRLAHKSESGSISFSKRDLARLTDDIKKKIEDNGLMIDEKPANIADGFILSYGDIEENASFDAIISSSKEELVDKINAILFG